VGVIPNPAKTKLDLRAFKRTFTYVTPAPARGTIFVSDDSIHMAALSEGLDAIKIHNCRNARSIPAEIRCETLNVMLFIIIHINKPLIPSPVRVARRGVALTVIPHICEMAFGVTARNKLPRALPVPALS
jgi:hypothetical protein